MHHTKAGELCGVIINYYLQTLIAVDKEIRRKPSRFILSDP